MTILVGSSQTKAAKLILCASLSNNPSKVILCASVLRSSSFQTKAAKPSLSSPGPHQGHPLKAPSPWNLFALLSNLACVKVVEFVDRSMDLVFGYLTLVIIAVIAFSLLNSYLTLVIILMQCLNDEGK
ncbi:hypothetical protein RJT34_07496 [Clitoria ternatea]|uniref:Uncharacterized protein n=1 Tax=Clitoria ternatea TaxID=43366 RepID=A0AAN9K3G9_CLITE